MNNIDKTATYYHKKSPCSLVLNEQKKQNKAMQGAHYTDTQWLSLLTEHLGTISFVLHQTKETDPDFKKDLETALVKLSAVSLAWIEEIRNHDTTS